MSSNARTACSSFCSVLIGLCNDDPDMHWCNDESGMVTPAYMSGMVMTFRARRLPRVGEGTGECKLDYRNAGTHHTGGPSVPKVLPEHGRVVLDHGLELGQGVRSLAIIMGSVSTKTLRDRDTENL